MIDRDSLFEEIKPNLALWCPSGQDTNDLARLAEYAVEHGVKAISAPADSVKFLWTCLEKEPIKILTRFDLNIGQNQNRSREQKTSNLSEQINTVFKQGADGAQVFIHYIDVPAFISDLQVIRDDLFFNKDLSIGLDVSEIGPFDWVDVFKWLRKIKAKTLLLSAHEEQTDAEFTGRIYGLLESWDNTFEGDLHFMLENDVPKIESAWRLIQKMNPQICKKIKFFIGN